MAWKALSQGTLQLSRMAVALILARLLAPDDWGLAAMAITLSAFVVVFTDSALGTALIQRREITEDDRSTVFWVSGGIGLVLTLAGIAVSGTVAAFYDEPQVRALFVAISIGFVVSALGSTQMALLIRAMEFRKLELRQIVATLFGAVVAIALALAGRGPWAIVGQQLAEAGASTALLWYLADWFPRFRVSRASLRKLGGFAGNVFGENLLYQSGRNLSGVMVGRWLGAAPLGAYTLATNVILVPFSRLAAPLQQVFFPAFAQMRDDRERMAGVWLRATRMVGAFSFPALVGLAVVAPDFVALVLGDRWDRVVPLIQILAVVGIVQSLQTLNGEVLLALDRSGTLLRFTIVWFAGSLAAVAAGLQWGVVGVAVAVAVATTAIEPLRTYLTTRALGISMWSFVRALGGVVQAAASMGIGLVLLREALVGAGAPAAARLPVLVLAGVGLYAAACFLRAPEVVEEVRGMLGARRRRTTSQPAEAGV